MLTGRPWLRDLGIGVSTMLAHYAIDALESWSHVLKALKRVQASPDGNAHLVAAIERYIAGTFFGYVAIGLFAGLGLHAWQRLVQPRRPVMAGYLAMVAVTFLVNLHMLILQPPLHDWFLFRPQVASWVPPEVPELLLLGFFAGSIVAGYRKAQQGIALRIAVFLPLVGVAGAVRWVRPADAPQKNGGPNIVILSFDALRPDHLGYFGYSREILAGERGSITPNIDRFLGEAAVWEHAYTPLARTWPSWVAMLTGNLPQTTGQRDPLPAPDNTIPSTPTLPQALSARGWATAFRTDDSRFSYMVPGMGFDRIEQPEVGIANFAISGSEPRFRAFLWLLDNPLGWQLVPVIKENQAFGRSYRNTRFNEGTLQTLAELSRSDHFYLAVHDCTLHAPADRYYPYTMMFGQRDYTGENRFRYLSLGSVSVSDALPEEREQKAAEQNIRLYDAGVVMIDRTFGRVVDELKASGLWENTIVVLMSDHGEDFYDPKAHYRFNGPNHGFHPWGEGQQRVVLGVHWPSGFNLPTGLQPNLASLVDLTPTLAGALDMEWPADGRSLYDRSARILYGETGLTEPFYLPPGHRQYRFPSNAQHYDVDPATGLVYARPEHRDGVIRVKDRFVQDENWRLIWHAMESGLYLSLYDTKADPDMHDDLAQTRPDVVRQLWPALRDRLRLDGEQVSDGPNAYRPVPPRSKVDDIRALRFLPRAVKPMPDDPQPTEPVPAPPGGG